MAEFVLESKARMAVCRIMRELKELGLNRGAEGNCSVRFGDGFFISPTGVVPEDMQPGQVVFMDMQGNCSGAWKPSSEWRMHLAIYRARAEAQAVVHTHADHVTALSSLREPLPPFHYMVAIAGGSIIDCANYATFGSEEIAENLLRALGPRRAAMLANHGLVCFHDTLEKAAQLAQQIESLAKQYLLARAVGEPKRLTDAEMAEVLEKFEGYGQQSGEGLEPDGG